MILSKRRILKALISLCIRTDWSAALMLANPEDRFSQIEAQIIRPFFTIIKPNPDTLKLKLLHVCLSLRTSQGVGYLFPCSLEINWLVPLYQQKSKICFLMRPVSQCCLGFPVSPKIWHLSHRNKCPPPPSQIKQKKKPGRAYHCAGMIDRWHHLYCTW